MYFLQKIIESSASGIIAVDLKGNVLVMNRAGRELLGYTSENAFNCISIKDLYPPGVAKEVMKKLRDPSICGKGKLRSTQVSILNAEGIEIPV